MAPYHALPMACIMFQCNNHNQCFSPSSNLSSLLPWPHLFSLTNHRHPSNPFMEPFFNNLFFSLPLCNLAFLNLAWYPLRFNHPSLVSSNQEPFHINNLHPTTQINASTRSMARSGLVDWWFGKFLSVLCLFPYASISLFTSFCSQYMTSFHILHGFLLSFSPFSFMYCKEVFIIAGLVSLLSCLWIFCRP